MLSISDVLLVTESDSGWVKSGTPWLCTQCKASGVTAAFKMGVNSLNYHFVCVWNRTDSEIFMIEIDNVVNITTSWRIAHLIAAIFAQSNIKVTKEFICFATLTKPLSTKPSCFVYVGKAVSQSALLKCCHVK